MAARGPTRRPDGRSFRGGPFRTASSGPTRGRIRVEALGASIEDTGRVREYVWGLDSRFLERLNASGSYSLRFDDGIGGGTSGKEDRYRANLAWSPEIRHGDLRLGFDFRYSDVDADLDRFDFREFEAGVSLDYHY